VPAKPRSEGPGPRPATPSGPELPATATSSGRDGAGVWLGPGDDAADGLRAGVGLGGTELDPGGLGAGALGPAGAGTLPIGWIDTQRPSHAIRIPA
jgi:hypothetical protein